MSLYITISHLSQLILAANEPKLTGSTSNYTDFVDSDVPGISLACIFLKIISIVFGLLSALRVFGLVMECLGYNASGTDSHTFIHRGTSHTTQRNSVKLVISLFNNKPRLNQSQL